MQYDIHVYSVYLKRHANHEKKFINYIFIAVEKYLPKQAQPTAEKTKDYVTFIHSFIITPHL